MKSTRASKEPERMKKNNRFHESDLDNFVQEHADYLSVYYSGFGPNDFHARGSGIKDILRFLSDCTVKKSAIVLFNGIPVVRVRLSNSDRSQDRTVSASSWLENIFMPETSRPCQYYGKNVDISIGLIEKVVSFLGDRYESLNEKIRAEASNCLQDPEKLSRVRDKLNKLQLLKKERHLRSISKVFEEASRFVTKDDIVKVWDELQVKKVLEL